MHRESKISVGSIVFQLNFSDVMWKPTIRLNFKMERSYFWMNNPPDFIYLFFCQFWRILKMDYPSQSLLVSKRLMSLTIKVTSSCSCTQRYVLWSFSTTTATAAEKITFKMNFYKTLLSLFQFAEKCRRVVFSTLFSVFHLMMKHCVSWLIYYT